MCYIFPSNEELIIIKNKIIYIAMNVIIFIIYLFILKLIWNSFIPFNTVTDIIAVFIILIIIFPLTLITTEFVYKKIKDG